MWVNRKLLYPLNESHANPLIDRFKKKLKSKIMFPVSNNVNVCEGHNFFSKEAYKYTPVSQN